VLCAAAVQLVQAAGVLVASVMAGIDTIEGKSYELASGIAITTIGIGTAIFLVLVARWLRDGRRWTRTPAVLTQMFTGIIGIYLVQSHKYWWGVPALALAITGFAALLAPPSLRQLTPGRPDEPVRRG
jgi:hypothetical protein